MSASHEAPIIEAAVRAALKRIRLVPTKALDTMPLAQAFDWRDYPKGKIRLKEKG